MAAGAQKESKPDAGMRAWARGWKTRR